MFGPLGFPEMLFIVVLALLIFGPKRLPEVGRTIGKGMAQFRKATSDLRRTIETEIALESEPPRPASRPGTAPRHAQLQLPGASLPASATTVAPAVAPAAAPATADAPGSPVARDPLGVAGEPAAVPPAVDTDPGTSQSS
jgi:TatA/E family protein of Tat protein translocase